jgi:hypothetical protein
MNEAHLMGSLRRFICAIRGHEDYLHFEATRIYLQCVACGQESPGWTVDGNRRSANGDRPSSIGHRPASIDH